MANEKAYYDPILQHSIIEDGHRNKMFSQYTNNEDNKIQSHFTDPTLQRSFRGHKNCITSSVFNPNMKQVITGSLDGTIMVWNFKPQLRPFKLTGHKGGIHDVAISPDGQTIASASNDETVRLWNNTVDGTSSVVKGHTKPVKSVDFSCDGKFLLTGSDDKIMKIVSVKDKKFVASLNSHLNWVKSAKFSPDSRMIVSGSDDRTVKIWDVAERKVIHTFLDHVGFINSVRFHPDGTCIASASSDKKIKIWDIRSKRLVQHYDAHDDAVSSISFHPSGNYLLSSSLDTTVKIWDLQNGQMLYTLHGHEGAVTSVNFSNCGDFFCSGGRDNIVMVWKSNINQMDEELKSFKVNETKLKSNKKIIDEKAEMLKYTTKEQLISGQASQTANIQNRNPQQHTKQPTQAKKMEENTMKTLSESHASNEPMNTIGTNTSNEMFNKLPKELSFTFDKMMTQLDVIAKTLKIFDTRLCGIEDHVTDIYSRQKYNVEYTIPIDKEHHQSKEIAYDEIEITGKKSGSGGSGIVYKHSLGDFNNTFQQKMPSESNFKPSEFKKNKLVLSINSDDGFNFDKNEDKIERDDMQITLKKEKNYEYVSRKSNNNELENSKNEINVITDGLASGNKFYVEKHKDEGVDQDEDEDVDVDLDEEVEVEVEKDKIINKIESYKDFVPGSNVEEDNEFDKDLFVRKDEEYEDMVNNEFNNID